MANKLPCYITSFAKSRYLPDNVRKWSAAVYQPEGFDFPKAAWTDIRDAYGNWNRPRDFLNFDEPLVAYREAMLSLYREREDIIEEWLKKRKNPFALCCWCPYDRAAQRQLRQWGSFVCHTAVIAEILTVDFKWPVWLDNDRLKMSVLTQRKEMADVE